MTHQPVVTCQATEYEVSLLPENDINRHVYTITVQYRGEGRWAVTRHSSCLGADGTWEFGVKEYDRGDNWLNSHRFDLDTALRLAREQAPQIVVNGRTAAEVVELTRPAPAPDDDPICGDQYDDEICELEPGHVGAHSTGTLCWDYAPERPRPTP
ncbi:MULTISPECIES: hypothetical protein [unclassified Streptomyces]|uniref:hypothetical protein n=1 Tax=unclassified Streptomyces TaxID=2593676 RepID=UPI00081D9F38|nr:MULTISPECIES: hypothetical protein [unclassified Streptomyces]MYZ37106.1 hypothetical protein [Streptomyces sp. SID4917]SCF88713.1 hypothetical protein GA0115259_104228 [Streptomyces sp. MnatMP-M17]